MLRPDYVLLDEKLLTEPPYAGLTAQIAESLCKMKTQYLYKNSKSRWMFRTQASPLNAYCSFVLVGRTGMQDTFCNKS